MSLRLLKCPGCGANLPPPSAPNGILVCEYCRAMVAASGAAVWPMPARPADDPPFAPDRPRVTLSGVRYVLLGRLGRGDGSDVFLARRDARLTELVTLKVLRALSDADLLIREYELLEELADSTAQGAEYFTRLLPQPVAKGWVKDPEGMRRTAVAWRWHSGFQHHLGDIRDAYPEGVPPRDAVWMWQRLLEFLGFLHQAGYAHGAVLPEHVLVHPRDRGAMLVGWSAATRLGVDRSPTLRSARNTDFYPEALWTHGVTPVAADLAMAARSIAYALGAKPGSAQVPDTVPGPLAALVREASEPERAGVPGGAWRLKERLDAVKRQCFRGERREHLTLPGWR